MGEEATFPGEDGRQLRDNIQCPTGVEETEKKKKRKKKRRKSTNKGFCFNVHC